MSNAFESHANLRKTFTPPTGESGKFRKQLTLEGTEESWNKDSSSSKCQWPSRRADERIEVRANSCP